MTKKESEAIYNQVVQHFNKDTGSYVKGYGEKKVRLMNSNHQPIMNFEKSILNTLLDNKVLVKEDLVYKLNIK